MIIVNGNLTAAIGIIATINVLALIFAGTLGVPTIGDFIVNQIISQDEIENGRVTQIDSEFDEGFDKTKEGETSVGGFFALLDGLKKVFSSLITILGLGFAVAGMLYAMGAPTAFVLIIGVPVGIVFYISIIGAVRGKDL